MKKSLSLLLALAMVFGMFASMASAADTTLTTEQKYQWFVDNKILKGGGANVNAAVTRAEAATFAISVGGLSEVTTSQTFSDVKKGQWWHGAIEAAAQAGLVNGIGGGKFGPKQSLTNEQYIKIAVTLAGLKPVAGAVVAGSSAWAGPYIQAAINAGLPLPANYKANATRGDVIDLSYTVYTFKAIPTLADVTAVANADDTITVTGKVVGKADSVKVALGTATAVAATLKDDKTFTYTTAKQSAGSYKLTVVAYDGVKASAAVEKSVTVDAFSVASVTVQNSKQIVVKFNKTVQSGVLAGGHAYVNAANKLEYYKLGTTTVTYPASASLSDDKQTVTLTFANAFANNTYEQLNIAGLKSASGLALTEYKQAISLSDTTAPSVAKVSYTGTKAVVTFSEPVKTAVVNGLTTISAAVSVNGIQVGLGSTPISYSFAISTEGYVTLTFNGLEAGKSYSLNLIAVEDLVGNRADLSTTLAVPSDTVPPTVVSVTPEAGNLRIKFSEPVQGYVKVTSAQGTVYTAANVNSDDNNELVATTSGWITSNFLNTSVTISDYYDLVNNKGANFTANVTLTKDTTAPVYSSALISGNKIVLKFNEALSAPAAAYQTADIDFISNDSVRQVVTLNSTNATFAYAYDANGNGVSTDSGENQYLVITVASGSLLDGTNLKNGTYTVKLPPHAVRDAAGNDNSSNVVVTASVSGNASTGNAIVKLNSVVQVGSKLTFAFDHLLTAAALDVNKYLINGTPLPAGTKFYFDATNDKVVVELPSGTIPVNGTRSVKVVNIADKDGNVLSTTTADVQKDVYLIENVKPTTVSAALTSDKSVSVTLSETVQAPIGSAAVSGVEVWINGNQVSYTSNAVSFGYNNNVLTISLTNANTFAPGQKIEVKFNGTNITDVNGNTITDGTATAQ